MATFTNQATLTYNGGTASSNITTGELLEVLTATKTAVVPTYRSGRPITYLITLVNAGTADLTGLAVADDLGGYTFNGATVYPLAYTAGSVRYYRNGVLQAAPAVTAGPPLTITGITVPAGGSTVIAYEAEPTAFAPLGAEDSVVNTVTVTGAGLPDAVTATETVSPATGPALTISKALSPTEVAANGRLTYTFVIQNTGNAAAEAADSLVVTDTFDPQLSDLTVTLNGTALTAPTQYTYDAATGQFATVAGVITVPAATFTQNAAAEAADSLVVTDTFDPQLSDLTVTLNGTALTAPTQYTYDAATGQFATVAGVITVPAATFTQNAAGAYSVSPGTSTLTISGTI